MKIRVTQTFRDRAFDLKERKAGTVYEVTPERAAVLIGKGLAESVAAKPPDNPKPAKKKTASK